MSWFRFLIGLFSEVSRGHVHEQFTRGGLAFNRFANDVLSPRHVPSIQTDLNSGDMSRGQNFVPATRFFTKIERSHDGICPRDMSLQNVPSCEPTFMIGPHLPQSHSSHRRSNANHTLSQSTVERVVNTDVTATHMGSAGPPGIFGDRLRLPFNMWPFTAFDRTSLPLAFST